jgi:hypothetical protein
MIFIVFFIHSGTHKFSHYQVHLEIEIESEIDSDNDSFIKSIGNQIQTDHKQSKSALSKHHMFWCIFKG